jgi:hypothetical protein
MKDFQLTRNNLSHLFSELEKELDEHPVLVVAAQSASTGKWGMARLWRGWMGKIGAWMAEQGAVMPTVLDKDGKYKNTRAFNENDAHELFTSKFLLLNAGGERLSWSKSGRDGMRAATKGERFFALQQCEEWATLRGIILFTPRDSEYNQLKQEAQS